MSRHAWIVNWWGDVHGKGTLAPRKSSSPATIGSCKHYARWLLPQLRRLANRRGEIELNLQSRIVRAQRAAERERYAQRASLMRRDASNPWA